MSTKVAKLAHEIVALSEEVWAELFAVVRREREEREEALALLKLAESSAARDWDNERDAVYDSLWSLVLASPTM